MICIFGKENATAAVQAIPTANQPQSLKIRDMTQIGICASLPYSTIIDISLNPLKQVSSVTRPTQASPICLRFKSRSLIDIVRPIAWRTTGTQRTRGHSLTCLMNIKPREVRSRWRFVQGCFLSGLSRPRARGGRFETRRNRVHRGRARFFLCVLGDSVFLTPARPLPSENKPRWPCFLSASARFPIWSAQESGRAEKINGPRVAGSVPSLTSLRGTSRTRRGRRRPSRRRSAGRPYEDGEFARSDRCP